MAVKQLDTHEVSSRELLALENEITLMQVGLGSGSGLGLGLGLGLEFDLR